MSANIVRQLAGLALYVGPMAVALSLAARLAHRTEAREGSHHLAVFWCFCIYVVLVATLTLAPPPISLANGSYGNNVVPMLYTLRCFVPNPGQPSTTAFCLRTILGNVAIFLPLGVLLPLVFESKSSVARVALVAAAGSVSIEFFQWFGRWVGSARWSDIDDVIFNVVGAVIGYAFYRIFRRAFHVGENRI